MLADFDNDGDLDILLTAIQGEGHVLFKNSVGQANNFIRITLEGRTEWPMALQVGVSISEERIARLLE